MYKMEQARTTVMYRFVRMGPGDQSVPVSGGILRLVLCADNWATQEVNSNCTH